MYIFRDDFHGIVLYIEKTYRDGRQLVKGGSSQLTVKQLHQRIGVKPCLADCIDGLMILHDMHNSEYAFLYVNFNFLCQYHFEFESKIIPS